MVAANDRARAVELLRNTEPFQEFDSEQLARIAGFLRPHRVAAGDTVVREGEPAQCWYLIVDGAAAVNHTDLTGQPLTLAVLGPGESFGEQALLFGGGHRAATISALTTLEMFALNRADLQHVCDAAPNFGDRLARRLELLAVDTALQRASPFQSLPRTALGSLARQMQRQVVQAGDVIVREGDPADSFYLLRSGAVEVVKRQRRLAVLRDGDSFGEIALLTPTPRTASVRAVEQTELLVLSRDTFHGVMREHRPVAEFFRELVSVRFRGAAGQPLMLPDPLTTIMPLVSPRRRKRYWLVLLIGASIFGLLTAIVKLGGHTSAVYGLMLVGSLVGPVVFVLYLAESNILSERPRELLITAALGAALGLPPAIWLQRQTGILPGSLASSALIAAIEEPAKVLGVVWLVWRPGLRFRMDGLIFGAAAGMGFAAIETGLYGLARAEAIGALVSVLWFRAVLSPFTHGTWTAIVCATIWRARTAGRRGAALRIATALAAGIVLHALWDWRWLDIPWNFAWLIGVGIAGLLTLRLILERAAGEEARSVAALAPEVLTGPLERAGLTCRGCGWSAPGGARYCPRCGLALRRTARDH